MTEKAMGAERLLPVFVIAELLMSNEHARKGAFMYRQ
jgi:hypothetical protein